MDRIVEKPGRRRNETGQPTFITRQPSVNARFGATAMTYLAPATFPSVFTGYRRPIAAIRGGLATSTPRGFADEDGARKTLGIDLQLPAAAQIGASMEHLARIALG